MHTRLAQSKSYHLPFVGYNSCLIRLNVAMQGLYICYFSFVKTLSVCVNRIGGAVSILTLSAVEIRAPIMLNPKTIQLAFVASLLSTQY